MGGDECRQGGGGQTKSFEEIAAFYAVLGIAGMGPKQTRRACYLKEQGALPLGVRLRTSNPGSGLVTRVSKPEGDSADAQLHEEYLPSLLSAERASQRRVSSVTDSGAGFAGCARGSTEEWPSVAQQEVVMKMALHDWDKQWTAPSTGLELLAPLVALGLAALLALL
jgi:hypothetical protein